MPIAIQTLADQLNKFDNLQNYPNAPEISDINIATLSLLQEALSTDSEHWFWNKLQSE